MRKLKNKKGITLVALIITIIVMLILVAVSVTAIVRSNLIGHAEKAGNEFKKAEIKEEQIGSYYEVNGMKYETTQDIAEGNSFVNAGERAIETSMYKNNNKIAYIPKGFTVSGIASEQSIEGGLVIYDIPENTTVDWTNPDSVKTAYNQFVWIPVNFEKQAGKDYLTDTNFNTVWSRSAWENNARTATQTANSFPGNSQDWMEMKYWTEPNSCFSATEITSISTQLSELKQSVYTYGGFWIGRYEAGSETERNSSSSQTAAFTVKQDKYPYNYIKWGTSMESIGTDGAVYLCDNLYSSENYGAKSMLCSGTAWDVMLDFIKDTNNVTNSTSWGNYWNSKFDITRGKYAALTQSGSNWVLGSFSTVSTSYTKAASNHILLTTGASERNKSKNIYDIAGNLGEWTTEAHGGGNRVVRGGFYNGDGQGFPVAHRYVGVSLAVASDYVGFRPILYVK